jgi:hypothetical protein
MKGHEADAERASGGAQIALMMFNACHDDGALDLGDGMGHIDNRRCRSIYGDDGVVGRRPRRRDAIKRRQRTPAPPTVRRYGLFLLATTTTNQTHPVVPLLISLLNLRIC